MTTRRKIRVLIVDDSAIVRKILSDTLSAEPDLLVVGALPDAVVAGERVTELRPDVVTVDIDMPRVDGITFLRELMATRPLPCIVISSVAQRGCDRAVEALEAGAVEVLAKPAGPFSVGELRQSLPQKVRAAAQTRVFRKSRSAPAARSARPLSASMRPPAGTLIAIGASTGGTEAIREVLQGLPANCPPVLIVQHIPPMFSKSFADRLNQSCAMSVREAKDGDLIETGVTLVAPGGLHMLVRRVSSGLQVKLNAGPRICYQRPSVEVLFQSIAQTAGVKALGVILTGMGNDGAAGLRQMREAGAHTIAQDEATSVVYGMPREAVRLGAAAHVLPLGRIAPAVSDWCGRLASEWRSSMSAFSRPTCPDNHLLDEA